MSDRSLRPLLRAVETIVVPDPHHGRVVVLRDAEGVADKSVCIPPPLVPIVMRFTGEKTCAKIAEELSAELGSRVDVDVILRAAKTLEESLFLEGPAYRAARQKVVAAFHASPTRPASHAGGAYLADPEALRDYVDAKCLGVARGGASAKPPRPRAERRPKGSRAGPRLVGLVAPHIDPWRGAVGYGHAYGALAEGLSLEADTFIVFGTSHAPMRSPFALCRKAFDTPFGAMECDAASVDRIAKAARFDPYADEFNHRREHSIEFQVVFLKHLLGARRARIVPVLAGLGAQQATKSDPERDSESARFLEAIREIVDELGPRAVLVAGADMAHVGPRFGDARAYDEGARGRLATTDKASLQRAAEGDALAFWSDVAKDLETRRVCGLAPIYSLLKALPGQTEGKVLHYEQTIDEEDGSIVSHAAVGFYG
jgi:AmmeMemoRadiSam system protein B